MEYYDVANPYNKTNEYYKDHYICLWEATDKEIVGHWQWEDLVENENWYEEIVIPRFSVQPESGGGGTLVGPLYRSFS